MNLSIIKKFKSLKAQRRFSKGQSVVEMALVLPVITILSLGGIEYVNLYVLGMRAASIGREASNLALRECSGITNPGNLEECLQRVVDRVGGAADHILPNFLTSSGPDGLPTKPARGTIVLTAWVTELDTTAQDGGKRGDYYDTEVVKGCDSDQTDRYMPPTLLVSVKCRDGIVKTSKIDTVDVLYKIFSGGEPNDASKDRLSSFIHEKGGYLFVAEIFYSYDPIVFDKTNMSEILPENGEIYQAGFF